MSLENTSWQVGESVESYLSKIIQPIVSRRNPGVNDKAPIGQLWINRTANTAFFLTQIANNQAVWSQAASVAGNLTAGGTITAGTGLVVSAGGATITGNSTVTGSLASTTTLASGTTLTAGTSLAVTTSAVIGTNLTITAGNITNTLGNIVATAGNIVCTLGNITATAGNITATLGDITATNGDVIISTATKGLTLPGSVRVITGAGAPANGLATAIGCLYIRTDAGAAAERVYVATGVGAWTNITAAA